LPFTPQVVHTEKSLSSVALLAVSQLCATDLRWPLPATLTDPVLEAMLYAGHGSQQGTRRKAEPECDTRPAPAAGILPTTASA
jgi:hypothetical protein